MYKKRILLSILVVLVIICFNLINFAAVISDNDGSAFITKSEFDSMKFEFRKQIDDYNSSIDNKICIEADRNELKKVIINLLSNATNYSDRNEKVIVNTQIIDKNLKFTITSKGIVLSERECTTAFDRASSSYPKYSTIGYGIGLYLSKKIVELHNGQIFASSDGEFNTFTFIIPMKKCEVILSGNI